MWPGLVLVLVAVSRSLDFLNCSCVPSQRRRFYHFDTKGEIAAGYNHQLSNLRAVISEGLILGRAVVVTKPSLTRKHNYDRPFLKDRWSDYIAFDESTFQLKKKRRVVCEGIFSSCVADVKEIPNATTKVTYQSGLVPEDVNAQDGLLLRTPSHSEDRVGLARRLTGIRSLLSQYHLTLTLKPPPAILAAVPPVLKRLQAETRTGLIAVVHARRGDKINRDKYCPTEMAKATSADHIATTLHIAGIPPGSSIYLMSNDHNFHHFQPLIDDFGYSVVMSDHFPHLAALLRGCHDDDPRSSCENYLLFAIENEIMQSVPIDHRIPTLPKHAFPHSPHYLMKDFLGLCKL